jgi:hypothetical protein
MEDTSYHIYAKDRVLYCNLEKEDFEEKWQLLNVMVGLIKQTIQRRTYHILSLPPKQELADQVGLSTNRSGKRILIDI